MGNQATSPKQNLFSSQNAIRRHNKHFNTTWVKCFEQTQIKQILKDLSITEQKNQSQSNSSLLKQECVHFLEFNDDFYFEKAFTRLQSRIGSSHKHLLNVKNIKVHEQKSLCSISRKLFISQQGFTFTLKDLFKKKQEEKKSFSQEQILTILNKVVQAVIWINDNEFKNVILDSQAITFQSQSSREQQFLENYTCKIVDQDIVQTNCYKYLLQKVIERRSSESQKEDMQKIVLDFYLSPELLQEFQNHNFYPSVSLKSDIFTLGMLMMEICCQQEMYFCYNMETLALDYESLIHRIAKISYSNELKLLIAQMLEYDENNRIGFVSLKEKIDKIMVKPFDETRKLKRRSSSTMLRQLLSCSRASYSVQNGSKPTLKNNSSCKISTVSLSAQKKENQQNFKKQKQSLQRKQHLLTKHNSLTKSNSLINLKCKTNSFLTSKKSTLMRVDSSKKLETQNKSAIQKQVKTQTNKVDYSKILKDRMKNQPKIISQPMGDQSIKSQILQNQNTLQESRLQKDTKNNNLKNIQDIKTEQIERNIKNQAHKTLKLFDAMMTDRSIHQDQMERVSIRTIHHSKFQQSRKVQNQNTQEKRQHEINKANQNNKFKHSFVQKKIINLDTVKASSSQKTLKSKSFVQNNKNKNETEYPSIKKRLLTEVGNQDFVKQNNRISVSLQKQKTKQSSISLKKIQQNKIHQTFIKKPDQKLSSEIKNNSKSWIMGKLKAKNFIQSNSKQKSIGKQKNNKSIGKKESSLTKIKSVSFAPKSNNSSIFFQKQNSKQQNQNTLNIMEINLQNSRIDLKQQNSQFKKGDTIIKRLQMTDEKDNIEMNKLEQQSPDSIKKFDVKNQIKFVEKVLQRCALSSSRWQDESEIKQNPNESSFRHQNLIKYSEYKDKLNVRQKSSNSNNKKQGQFKKKSKVIDIDLCRLNNNNKLKQQVIKQNIGQNSTIFQYNEKKTDKQATSKLKKLKQLTILTEDQQKNIVNDNKQNSMRNSNLQDVISERKIVQLQEQIKKSNIKVGINQNTIPAKSLLGLNEIPYQRIEYGNRLSTVIPNPALTTPSNLNDLNKFYGKGMTVESSNQQSTMHRKNNSTLSKPFQEIQLDYEHQHQQYDQRFRMYPLISSPNLNKAEENIFKEQQNQQNKRQNTCQKKITLESIKKQCEIFTMNNSDELTFRLRTGKLAGQQANFKGEQKGNKETVPSNKLLQMQKLSYYEKQDGSFVMREQNPNKKIQTSSIIEKNNKIIQQTGHFQEYLTFSNSNFHNKQIIQSQYEGYKESFLDECDGERIMRQEGMNSSCSSINLSEIQYKAQKGESIIFGGQQKDHQKKQSNSKRRKYKHISILQHEEQNRNRSHDLSINLKNVKNNKQHNQENVIIQSNHESQQNTYRGYLKSDNCNNYKIELDNNFFYEGQLNQQGQFEGSGMIYRKSGNKDKNILIYTGSFSNGLYHGFGTLYWIPFPQKFRLNIPNYENRITFGSQRNPSAKRMVNEFTQSQLPIKYEGEFSKGKQNGFGTYFYSNGDKFSGCIKQGAIQGYGTYHSAQTGEIISGMWKNNIFLN